MMMHHRAAATAVAPPKLEVREVGVSFAARNGRFEALTGVSMRVAENELVAIVGGSGCGKSTLLKVIGGLLPATAGTVLVDGRAIEGPGADRGMVFQSYSLYPWLSVYENVAFGLRLRGASEAAIKERVEHHLAIVSLFERRNAAPHELSGGMKQRVAIARALANEPSLLLLDEPFGALDAQTRARMQEFLLDLWGRTRMTMLIITHDIEEAVFLSNRVYLMKGPPGRIVTERTIDLPAQREGGVKFSPRFNELRRELLDHLTG